jgi:hypothetical protein
MTDIQHLSGDEQLHFIKCDCGEYIDMRNLQQIFELNIGQLRQRFVGIIQ